MVPKIVRSRIATFDIFDVGLRKHHVQAMLEFDVTESRAKLREQRKMRKLFHLDKDRSLKNL